MTANAMQELPHVGVWSVEPIHSSIRFSIRHHSVATFWASFDGLEGRYDADTGTLVGEVMADNVQVPVTMLRDHLLTPAFFDATNHPVIRFESTSINEKGGRRLDVTGSLTLRGITREVHAAGTVRAPVAVRHPDGSEADHFGIDLSLTIDRRDYGVSFNAPLPGGRDSLGWEVTIEAALEMVTH